MPVITLTTDFGEHDWFVGTMKGVIAGINPAATVIDVTHAIPPGDIRAGAFALTAAFRFFPKGTVHVVVVDPGVGSSRRALAVRTATHVFVGPDNGVLSWALRTEKVLAAHALENTRYLFHPVSRTFHGRDVFAPAAAHLSRGLPIQKLGPAVSDFVRLAWPEPQIVRGGLRGEVIYIDRFGNAITNLKGPSPTAERPRSAQVFVRGKCVCHVAEFYGAVPAGAPVAVFGSTGFLELAINGGNAARSLHLRVGSQIVLRPF